MLYVALLLIIIIFKIFCKIEHNKATNSVLLFIKNVLKVEKCYKMTIINNNIYTFDQNSKISFTNKEKI